MSSTPSALQAENSLGSPGVGRSCDSSGFKWAQLPPTRLSLSAGLEIRITPSTLPELRNLTGPVVLSALGSGLCGPPILVYSPQNMLEKGGQEGGLHIAEVK